MAFLRIQLIFKYHGKSFDRTRQLCVIFRTGIMYHECILDGSCQLITMDSTVCHICTIQLKNSFLGKNVYSKIFLNEDPSIFVPGGPYSFLSKGKRRNLIWEKPISYRVCMHSCPHGGGSYKKPAAVSWMVSWSHRADGRTGCCETGNRSRTTS